MFELLEVFQMAEEKGRLATVCLFAGTVALVVAPDTVVLVTVSVVLGGVICFFAWSVLFGPIWCYVFDAPVRERHF